VKPRPPSPAIILTDESHKVYVSNPGDRDEFRSFLQDLQVAPTSIENKRGRKKFCFLNFLSATTAERAIRLINENHYSEFAMTKADHAKAKRNSSNGLGRTPPTDPPTKPHPQNRDSTPIISAPPHDSNDGVTVDQQISALVTAQIQQLGVTLSNSLKSSRESHFQHITAQLDTMRGLISDVIEKKVRELVKLPSPKRKRGLLDDSGQASAL